MSSFNIRFFYTKFYNLFQFILKKIDDSASKNYDFSTTHSTPLYRLIYSVKCFYVFRWTPRHRAGFALTTMFIHDSSRVFFYIVFFLDVRGSLDLNWWKLYNIIQNRLDHLLETSMFIHPIDTNGRKHHYSFFTTCNLCMSCSSISQKWSEKCHYILFSRAQSWSIY
jgi:hypothetical protein